MKALLNEQGFFVVSAFSEFIQLDNALKTH
jgi:hypothetical protein